MTRPASSPIRATASRASLADRSRWRRRERNSWTALPTTFTGSQLVAHFDDAGLRGAYTFSVRSCDNVGNCASTSRTVMLPARAQAVSEVSLEQLSDHAMRQRRPLTRSCRRSGSTRPAPAGERVPGGPGQAGLAVSL